ncbi:MAG: PAS domain-containing sensor histidine kinase [Polyangiales bacterium]
MPTPPDEPSKAPDALFEAAACGLLVTEANGTIVRVNRALAGILGREVDALVGKLRLQDVLTIGCKIFHQTHWMPLLQIQGSVAEVQLEMVDREGNVIPVLVNALRREEDGKVRHHVAVFVATDRRKYERELLQARKHAEALLASEREAQSARDLAESELRRALHAQERDAQARALLAEQLIGIVSHDLRTPLNAVLLGAKLLSASEMSAAQGRTVARIGTSAQRAARLIVDLLDFTQARLGGGLRVERASIDLHPVIADCVEELKLAWPGRMIAHRARGEGAVEADADRLAQVVTNLANNALTYGTSDRAVTVTSEVDGDTFALELHNDGTPIPEDLLPHLFEPLRRGEQQVRLGSRSVGLGLYIVQQIALAHGGTVTVRSRAEEGTTFSVRLPSGRPTP